jgi:predicted MFS family arabinose efflux permease
VAERNLPGSGAPAPETPAGLLEPLSGQRFRQLLLIAAGLALGPAVVLGLGRFAYSLLLPAMRMDLHWSFARAGAMNTANAAGYLAGAIAAGPLLTRTRCRRPYVTGLVLTALAVLASAASGSFAVLLALRLVAGITGAVVFIAGAGLMARLSGGLPPGRSAALLGSYFSGSGFGIVVSAGIVPPVASPGTGASWRWGWVILGVASLAALAGAAPASLKAPEPEAGPGQGLLVRAVRRMAPAMAGYTLFGAGYIAYVTFIVAFLRAHRFGPGEISVFWAVLGAVSMMATFGWGPVLGRLRGGRGPAAVLTVVTAGALLPLAAGDTAGDFTSAVLFGGGFLAVVTAMINLARRSLPPAQVTPAIAVLTVAFGIGQILGPVLAGVLSDGPGGVRAGLGLSAALLAAGLAACLIQPALPARPPPGAGKLPARPRVPRARPPASPALPGVTCRCR